MWNQQIQVRNTEIICSKRFFNHFLLLPLFKHSLPSHIRIKIFFCPITLIYKRLEYGFSGFEGIQSLYYELRRENPVRHHNTSTSAPSLCKWVLNMPLPSSVEGWSTTTCPIAKITDTCLLRVFVEIKAKNEFQTNQQYILYIPV